MNSWVRVGAKCVCVDDHPGEISGDNGGLVVDADYQIIEVSTVFSELAVRIIGNGICTPPECYLRASRFRPLIPIADDIALFTEIAKLSKLDQLATTLSELA